MNILVLRKITIKALALCTGFFSLVYLGSCKERTYTRPDLIPDEDRVNTEEVSDFRIELKAGYRDSIVTNSTSYALAGIGAIDNDAFFGKTQAALYFNIVPPGANFKFGNAPTLDSVVLVLPYITNSRTFYTYGDTSVGQMLHLTAHRLTQKINDLGDTIYAFNRLSYSSQALGNASIDFRRLRDTVYLANNDTVSGLLRMRLENSFGQEILNTDTHNLASHANFYDYFNGLYLGPDPTKENNQIAYFSLFQGFGLGSTYQNAHVEFYYHLAGDTGLYSRHFALSSLTGKFFNGIYRNALGTPSEKYKSPQGVASDTVIINGYPGFYTDVTIHLDDKIPQTIINNAKLTITAISSPENNKLLAPRQILASGINDDGSLYSIADLSESSGSTALLFFDGAIKEVTINNQTYTQYVLNIPRELQKALTTGASKIKLRLFSSNNYTGAFKVLGYGSQADPALKIKFDVTYSSQ